MSSAARALANRANATRSTGPADTSRTRFNGVAHGLTSKQTVIPGESQADYDEVRASFLSQLAPASEVENVLAERIVNAAWRLRRFFRMETAFFSNRIDAFCSDNPDQDPDSALANLFVDPAEASRMRLFLRYQNTVQREYDKAIKEFETVKAERQKQEAERAMLAAYRESENLTRATRRQTEGGESPEPFYEPAVGFASYAAPSPLAAAAGA